MENCPTCERGLKEIKDFPSVYILSFQRIQLPELIAGEGGFGDLHPERKLERVGNEPLPAEVLELFSGKDAVVHKGTVYRRHYVRDGVQWYTSAQDITAIVQEAVSQPVVQKTLATLESYVGREVRTKDLFGLPGFGTLQAGDYDDLSLSFFDEGTLTLGHITCKLSLIGGWSGGSISCATVSQDLAVLEYEGRINKSR